MLLWRHSALEGERQDLVARRLWIAFAAGLLTQRLGLLVSGFPFALDLVFVIAPVLMLWVTGAAQVHWGRLCAFYALFAASAASFALNEGASIPSYVLFLGLYAPLCLHVPLADPALQQYRSGVIKVAAALAVAGILQFLLQFAFDDPELLFSWRRFVPAHFLIEYASVNRLGDTSIFRSNGVFFLEPSAFGQFLARAILLSLVFSAEKRWAPLLVAALVLTYSGSGLLILAVFGPLVLLTPKLWRGFDVPQALLLVSALLVGIVLAPGAVELLNLSNLFDRAGELNAQGSSGYARYGSTPALLQAAFGDRETWHALVFGLGSGRTDQFTSAFHVEVFATAWVKLLIEYGVAGLAAMVVFLGVCVWTSTRSAILTGAFLFHFLMLDGNVLVPQQVLVLAFLAVLPSRARSYCAESIAEPCEEAVADYSTTVFRPAASSA